MSSSGMLPPGGERGMWTELLAKARTRLTARPLKGRRRAAGSSPFLSNYGSPYDLCVVILLLACYSGEEHLGG